jgi:hypothetical protein
LERTDSLKRGDQLRAMLVSRQSTTIDHFAAMRTASAVITVKVDSTAAGACAGVTDAPWITFAAAPGVDAPPGSMNVDLTVGSGCIVRVRTSSVPPYSKVRSKS